MKKKREQSKRPENELAASVLAKVKSAKPAPEIRVPASSILSRLTVKLPSEDKRGPLAPKKKAQPKGGES